MSQCRCGGFLDEPDRLRDVGDDGAESLSGRLAGIELTVTPDADLNAWIEQALATAEECRGLRVSQQLWRLFQVAAP